jgi:catechol-2,3-dioxygenase
MSLIETTPAPTPPALPKTLRLGAAHLTVIDLDRSVAWYERSLGMRVHATGAHRRPAPLDRPAAHRR